MWSQSLVPIPSGAASISRTSPPPASGLMSDGADLVRLLIYCNMAIAVPPNSSTAPGMTAEKTVRHMTTWKDCPTRKLHFWWYKMSQTQFTICLHGMYGHPDTFHRFSWVQSCGIGSNFAYTPFIIHRVWPIAYIEHYNFRLPKHVWSKEKWCWVEGQAVWFHLSQRWNQISLQPLLAAARSWLCNQIKAASLSTMEIRTIMYGLRLIIELEKSLSSRS